MANTTANVPIIPTKAEGSDGCIGYGRGKTVVFRVYLMFLPGPLIGNRIC